MSNRGPFKVGDTVRLVNLEGRHPKDKQYKGKVGKVLELFLDGLNIRVEGMSQVTWMCARFELVSSRIPLQQPSTNEEEVWE